MPTTTRLSLGLLFAIAIAVPFMNLHGASTGKLVGDVKFFPGLEPASAALVVVHKKSGGPLQQVKVGTDGHFEVELSQDYYDVFISEGQAKPTCQEVLIGTLPMVIHVKLEPSEFLSDAQK